MEKIGGIKVCEWEVFIHFVIGQNDFSLKGADRWQDIPSDWRRHHGDPPTRFRLGGLQNIGQFHQLVGRTGLIFKQTLTGSVPKWMTRNRYPVDTCTAQLASRVICIYVFAPCVRFHSRDFRLESCLCASFSRPKPFHPRETGLIMRVGKSWITLSVFASYVHPNIRNT